MTRIFKGLAGDGARIQVNVDGIWYDVPGLSEWREAGRRGRATQQGSLEGRVFAGEPSISVPQIECTVSELLPSHPVWEALQRAATNIGNRSRLDFRIVIPQRTVYQSGTEKATLKATTGQVVLTRGDDELTVFPDFDPVGLMLWPIPAGIGVNTFSLFILNENLYYKVLSNGPFTTDYDWPIDLVDCDGAGFRYELVTPTMIRGPFSAAVKGANTLTLQAEGEVLTQLSLQPRHTLPLMTLGDPDAQELEAMHTCGDRYGGEPVPIETGMRIVPFYRGLAFTYDLSDGGYGRPYANLNRRDRGNDADDLITHRIGDTGAGIATGLLNGLRYLISILATTDSTQADWQDEALKGALTPEFTPQPWFIATPSSGQVRLDWSGAPYLENQPNFQVQESYLYQDGVRIATSNTRRARTIRNLTDGQEYVFSAVGRQYGDYAPWAGDVRVVPGA